MLYLILVLILGYNVNFIIIQLMKNIMVYVNVKKDAIKKVMGVEITSV
jgi:hypothetical protein